MLVGCEILFRVVGRSIGPWSAQALLACRLLLPHRPQPRDVLADVFQEIEVRNEPATSKVVRCGGCGACLNRAAFRLALI